jgi:hypothetical protein
MELLCPSCQRRLTIPDQYAGQMMKCPLCGHSFTAPALAPVPEPATAPPPPMPTPDRAAAAPPPLAGEPPLAPVQPAKPPAPPPTPSEYTHYWSIWLSPKVLQWVAVGAIFLAFVLTFFTWIRGEPQGLIMATQNGWQAAFGGESLGPDWPKGKEMSKEEHAGVCVPLLFYLLLLILLILLSAAAAALSLFPITLPPAVQRLLPWRWALVAGLAALAFLLLVLQLLVGFSVENKAHAAASEMLEDLRKGARDDTTREEVEKRAAAAHRAVDQSIIRTRAVTLVFWLTLIAVLCAGLTFRADFHPHKPTPRIDILW